MKPASQLPDVNLQELAELCASAPNGLIVELGVYKGGSAWALNEVSRGRKLYLFDTFKGIPSKAPGDQLDVGAFNDVSLDDVKAALPDAIFHVGPFPDTLTDDIKDIAFAHIDCDQGSTCNLAIKLLWPLMVEGGVMAFDDYPFEGIKKAIHDNFTTVQFTENKIPYVIKEKK